MLGTPTDVANVYVLTIPPNKMVMLHQAPCLHLEFSLTRMCLGQLIISLGMCFCLNEFCTSKLLSNLARCKNHLWRSFTANIEGEQLPGPIVTCNSAFGGTFHAGSSAGGSAPANDSEVEWEASIQDLVANYLNSATALHLAAQNSYPRCNQFPNCWSLLKDNKSLVAGFDQKVLITEEQTQRHGAVTHEFGNFCCSVHCERLNHKILKGET
ncbi:hypothetical protein Bca4012_076225 [Brassica carinata]